MNKSWYLLCCTVLLVGCESEKRVELRHHPMIYHEKLTQEEMDEIAPAELWEDPVRYMPYQDQKYVFGKDREEAWDDHNWHWFYYKGEWHTNIQGCSCKLNHPTWAGDFDSNGHCESCYRGDSRPGACNCKKCLCPMCGHNPEKRDHPNAERNKRLSDEYEKSQTRHHDIGDRVYNGNVVGNTSVAGRGAGDTVGKHVTE